MLAGDDLTIVLFFLASAMTLGIAGAQTVGWKSKFLAGFQFLFCAVCLVIAVGWFWIKPNLPSVATTLATIATHPISWYVAFILAIAILTLTRRPASEAPNSRELPIWAILVLGLTLFIVALFVYPSTLSPSSANEDLERRLAALESRPVVQPSEHPNFGQQLASLERQVNLITPLGRYLLYDDCLSELSEIDHKFSASVKNAKAEVLSPPSPPIMFSSPLSVWQKNVDAIMAAAKRCYPKKQIDLNAEPTPEEMGLF
jgi:hypothetical protein